MQMDFVQITTRLLMLHSRGLFFLYFFFSHSLPGLQVFLLRGIFQYSFFCERKKKSGELRDLMWIRMRCFQHSDNSTANEFLWKSIIERSKQVGSGKKLDPAHESEVTQHLEETGFSLTLFRSTVTIRTKVIF